MEFNTETSFSLKEKVRLSELPEEKKEMLIDIIDRKKVIPLYYDKLAKKAFSPDTRPERFNFIMQRVMQDNTIISKSSATNEPPVENVESKGIVTDLPSWLEDSRYADLEIQPTAEEFIFSRAEIYSSRMLVFQYSAQKGNKKDRNYENTAGIVLVILMRDSPKIFKDFDSTRYIHRIKYSVTDSGLKVPQLRQIAFVQLDKALEQFIFGTYNEDEDIELLGMLAMIADLNNGKVRELMKDNTFLKDVYEDAEEFSEDLATQIELIHQEFYEMDRITSLNHARREGRAEGAARINDLNAWLLSNNRIEDLKRAVTDKNYQEQLLKEFMSQKQ